MPVTAQDITMWRGESKLIRIAATGISDYTGAQLMWRVARGWTSSGADIFITKTLGAGIEVVNNAIEITLTSLDTFTLAARGYYHQLDVKLADGRGGPVTIGTLTINQALPPIP